MEKKSAAPDPEINSIENQLEYPPTIEPLFWGTGEMLVWDLSPLIAAIDREAVCTHLTANGERPSPSLKDEFYRQMEQIAGKMAQGTLGGPRGFYSFFPVVTEGTSVIVLDPSDFHTELLNLQFSAKEKINGRPVAEYFRPDGDLISFSAFSTGCNSLIESIDEVPESTFSTEAIHSAFERGVASLLESKITLEMRRALGLEADVGRSLPFRPDSVKHPGIVDRLFELLCIEDRLGIAATTDKTHENYPAAVRYFIRHPAAE